jgi:NSS family neurotransmitter:Na+ symporter
MMLLFDVIHRFKHNPSPADDNTGYHMQQRRISQQGTWSSKWGFMLATAGAAVGLGNIWKFPYIAGEYGGGAFVLVYLICVVTLGLPILMAEILLGRRGSQNPAAAIAVVAKESARSPYWKGIGYLLILAGALILSYYSVIAGWAVDYTFKSAQGSFTHGSAESINDLFIQLVSDPKQLIFWHSVLMLATVFILALGIREGLERAVLIMFPGMLILLLVLIGYAYDSGFFEQGVTFLFKPDFAKLTPKAVLIALGHAFFTLSVATGSIITYGAYVPRHVSIAKSSLFIVFADTLVALIAGLAIFPLVFANGLEPGAGPGLIFQTLPLAFGHMPYGQIFATLFFIMLVLAAFTSAISLLEPAVAWVSEKFQLSRVLAATLAGTMVWLVGLGSVFSFNIWQEKRWLGLNYFELVDYLTANIMLPLGGLLVAVFSVWVIKFTIVADELAMSSKLALGLWRWVMRYIAPLAITLVMLNAVGIICLNGAAC